MNDYFEPNFTNEDDDEDIEVDECVCSECNGTFLLPLNIEDLEECPLCGAKFD